MIFLDSPAIGEAREVWIAWLDELRGMDQSDGAVRHAITHAEVSLRAMDEAGTDGRK